jgi:hypothetical protein
MTKSMRNFEKLANQSSDCVDTEMRRFHDFLINKRKDDVKLISLFDECLKEAKKQIRKELRQSWKPQDW